MSDLTNEKMVINDLYLFYRYFVGSTFKENLPAKHIKELSRKLMRLYKNKFQRMCVAIPPRMSKSSLITLSFPLWLITHDPTLNILVVTSSGSLAESFGIRIRELFNKHAESFGLRISDKKHASGWIMFEDLKGNLQSGSIRLIGSGSQITGFDVDYAILDDIYSGAQDIVPSQLEKKIDWFKTIILQRLEPHSKLLIVGTRWHTNDLQGYLELNAPKGYEFIKYTALNKDGTCIWPERYSIDFFKHRQKEMGERQFQAIYQQKPLDLTSDFFHTDKIIFEDTFDDYIIAQCRSWDIAASDDSLGDQRDYTAGMRMCKTPGNQYWIFDYERGQYGNSVKHIIKDTARLDTPNHTILLETGVGTSDLLFNDYKEALTGYNVIQSKPQGAKVDRATPLANAMYDGQIHICINNDNKRQLLLSELKSFPNGKHDDCVDALAHGFNYLSTFKDAKRIATGGTRHRRSL